MIPARVDHPEGYVVKASSTSYFVKSRTTPGAWWLVSGNDCSCPADVQLCWHVRRTYEYERMMSTPRPTAPPAPASMFVD